MKTNVSIELTDTQRNRLACKLDGKTTKRLATRAEVGALCRCFVDSLVAQGPYHDEIASQDASGGLMAHTVASPEDSQVLAGKHPDYIRGWNKVKHGLNSKA